MDFEKTLKSIKERTKQINDNIYEHDMNVARAMRELSRYTRDTLTHLANIDKTLAEMQISQNAQDDTDTEPEVITPIHGIMYHATALRDDQVFAARISRNIYLVVRKINGVLTAQRLDYRGFTGNIIIQPNDIITDGNGIYLNVSENVNMLFMTIPESDWLTTPMLLHEIKVPSLVDDAFIINYSMFDRNDSNLYTNTFDRNDSNLYTNVLFGLNDVELISDEDSVTPALYLAVDVFMKQTPCSTYVVTGVFALEFNTELKNRCVPNVVFILSMVSGIDNKDEHTTMNALLGYFKNFTRQHFKFKYYGYGQLDLKLPTIRELEIAETLMNYTAKELDNCL